MLTPAMPISFDVNAANAVFALPDVNGAFDGPFRDYLRELGARRPLVMLAFPPKAAGTFLRAAAVIAIGGQGMRVTHAQGGRDATPYLPVFILYYAGGFPAATMVTHLHMQALPANRAFLEAFGIRPVVMIRDVADMLASYWDMLDEDQACDHWLNWSLPRAFPAWSDDNKADFLIDMLGPWYASYYESWLSYAQDEPERVLLLRYRDFRDDAVGALAAVLKHSGVGQPREVCQAAVEQVWQERQAYRFNRGVEGRGRERFRPQHIERLKRLMFRHYDLGRFGEELLAPRGA